MFKNNRKNSKQRLNKKYINHNAPNIKPGDKLIEKKTVRMTWVIFYSMYV